MRALRALALLVLVGFGSCAQLAGNAPTVNDTVIIPAVTQCNTPPYNTPVAANDYQQVGFAKVWAACEVFFVNATRLQQNANSANQTLTAGLAGAAAIVPLVEPASAAVKALAITSAGVLFGTTVINDYANIYSFGNHLYKVRQLVYQDMTSYVTSASLPTDTCVAYYNVQQLATKCTLANMEALLDQQVAIQSQACPSGQTAVTQNGQTTCQPANAAGPKALMATRGGAPRVSPIPTTTGPAIVTPTH